MSPLRPRLRWYSLGALLLGLCTAPLDAQPTRKVEPLLPYAGVWQAQHQGKVFAVLTLRGGTSPAGTLRAGTVNTDEHGRVNEVTQEANAETRIVGVRLEHGRLWFDTRDEVGELLSYEMRLLDDGQAELRVVDAPLLQPFSLRRTARTPEMARRRTARPATAFRHR